MYGHSPPQGRRQSPRQSPGASEGVELASDRRPYSDKYCSCLFKTTGRNYQSGYGGNPYAICSASIFNRRGLRGPGTSLSCRYPREYLDRVSYDELFWYAAAKGLVSDADYGLDSSELTGIILEWFSLNEDIGRRTGGQWRN